MKRGDTWTFGPVNLPKGTVVTIRKSGIVLGLSGKLRAGKDEVAKRLVERWGFTRVSFADGLREELEELLPTTIESLHDLQPDVEHIEGCRVVGDNTAPRAECLKRMLYVTKPRGFRQLQQEFGTGVRRRQSATYWTDRWRERVAGVTRVVAPDVRFPNEAAAVEEAGGKLWRIMRPGTVQGTHESETALDGWRWWDAVLNNDSTVPALWAHVDRLAREMGLDPADGMAAPAWPEVSR